MENTQEIQAPGETVTEVTTGASDNVIPNLLEHTQEIAPSSSSRQVRSKYSRPSFNRELNVFSLQAQRVLNRSLSRVAYSLFSIDVILQIIGKRDQIDEVENAIKGMITQTHTQIVQTTQQIAAVKTQNNVTEMPTYTAPKKYRVEITSPHVGQFVNMISMLDSMIIDMDALWLYGVLENKERSNAVHEWQQQLNSLASRIITVEKKARDDAQRQGKAKEVEEEVPLKADDAVEALDDETPETASDAATV